MLTRLPKADQNVYKIKTWDFPGAYSMFLPTNRLVDLTKSPDEETEFPSPILLATHAAIAQIVDAAGVAKAIDSVIVDFIELLDVRHLFSDGSTNQRDSYRF
jgi:hypothetical protein